MADIPSDAELGILTVLWRCGPSTVREVHETLAKDTRYTSTLKQMQVMHEKGLLRRSERHRSHIYLTDGLWKGKAELVARFVTADGKQAGNVVAMTMTLNLHPATWTLPMSRSISTAFGGIAISR